MADAKIFLSDCLACDSCVTAEEGLQVSQQNAKDFFRVLNLNKVGLLGTCWCCGLGVGGGGEARKPLLGHRAHILALALCPLLESALSRPPAQSPVPSLMWYEVRSLVCLQGQGSGLMGLSGGGMAGAPQLSCSRHSALDR